MSLHKHRNKYNAQAEQIAQAAQFLLNVTKAMPATFFAMLILILPDFEATPKHKPKHPLEDLHKALNKGTLISYIPAAPRTAATRLSIFTYMMLTVIETQFGHAEALPPRPINQTSTLYHASAIISAILMIKPLSKKQE